MFSTYDLTDRFNFSMEFKNNFTLSFSIPNPAYSGRPDLLEAGTSWEKVEIAILHSMAQPGLGGLISLAGGRATAFVSADKLAEVIAILSALPVLEVPCIPNQYDFSVEDPSNNYLLYAHYQGVNKIREIVTPE